MPSENSCSSTVIHLGEPIRCSCVEMKLFSPMIFSLLCRSLLGVHLVLQILHIIIQIEYMIVNLPIFAIYYKLLTAVRGHCELVQITPNDGPQYRDQCRQGLCNLEYNCSKLKCWSSTLLLFCHWTVWHAQCISENAEERYYCGRPASYRQKTRSLLLPRS